MQSAKKFGKFKESSWSQNTVLSHIKLLNDEDMFAICGLNTSYLFHNGSWRIFYPATNTQSRAKEMIFEEFDREKILKHFRFDFEQFKLFGVLGGKLDTKLEWIQDLKKYFIKFHFQSISDFVHRFAPPHKFPLQRETIEEILFEIFGSADDQLIEDFKESLLSQPLSKISTTCDIIEDEKTKKLLQNDSFSSFAECILYDIPLDILSPFLDVKATDMKTLKDLTIDWIERFAGILLKDFDETKSFSIIYRVPSGNLETYQATPQLPCEMF